MSAERSTADWASTTVARDWARNDMWADLLPLPRQLACAIEWTRRYVAVRPPFIRPAAPRASHAHSYPFLSPQVHLEALRDAGIGDPAIPWAAFSLCLFMGRKAPK